MEIIPKPGIGQLKLAAAFDIDLIVAVDQNIGNRLIREQWLKRTEADHFIDDIIGEIFDLGSAHGKALIGDRFGHENTNLRAQLVRRHLVEIRQIQFVDQFVVDLQFRLEQICIRAGRHRFGRLRLGALSALTAW